MALSRPRTVSRCESLVTVSMPSPPAGLVPARITLRTKPGSSCAISWAIMPPIENPSRSTCSKPRARMNVSASVAISWIVSGVLLVEAPTPRLSNVIIRCWAAMPSTTRASQLSSTAARWVRNTTRTPVFGPSSRPGWRLMIRSRPARSVPRAAHDDGGHDAAVPRPRRSPVRRRAPRARPRRRP